LTTLFTTRTRVAAATALLALMTAGCQTAPQNRGTSGYRIDPTSDSAGEAGARTPHSADLVGATDEMAMSLARRLDVNDRSNPPVVFVGAIENRSSMPAANYQVFLTRLRGQLQESGVRNGINFVRERAFMENQRAREYGVDDPASGPDSYRSRADYVLTCVVSDLPSGATNYYYFDYQLVQLRDAVSGPGRGVGDIVWEQGYEVKYQ
jgi:hypothetical protein